jgi:amino acid adenylation domain-containing protein
MPASQYAREVAAQAAGDEARETEAYWLTQYRTVPPPLDLPLDRPRPPVATFNGGRLVATFDRDLAQRVRRFATAHRTTPFATLLAAFQVLVARLTGQHDFVVGVPMAGQVLVDAESLVTHGVNFIALRCAPDPEASFARHAADVTRHVLDATDHQHYTYLQLLHALRLPRSLARDPLVAVSFTLEPSFAEATFAGLPSAFLSVPRATSRRDLHVNVMETPAGLAVEADYNADVLDAATVQGWLAAYRACLEAALGDPSRPLGTLPIGGGTAVDAAIAMPAPEVERELAHWGQGRDVTPPAASVPAAFERQAAATPDAVAVICGPTRLTYAALNAAANRLAAVLAAEGAAPGTLVALALDRSAESIVATLAVLKAGAAYVPLDMTAPDARLRYILDDTRPVLVLAAGAAVARCRAAGDRVIGLDDLETRLAGADGTDRPLVIDRDAPAYVMYTSGSTGEPKGVVVPHRGILRLVFGLDAVDWDDVRSVLHMAPTSFDASTFEIFAPLLRGRQVVVAPGGRVTLDALGAVLTAAPADTLWLTAALFNTIVDERPALLADVRQLLTGGEAVSAAHVRRAQAALPHLRLINGYGPTETTTFACCHVIPRLDATDRSVPIGRPLGGTHVSVRDASGRLVPPGVRGELWIGGDGVALGYLHQPALTDERFPRDPDGPAGARLYRTGDEVAWRADGTLEFLGRRDRQVKLRGFRIEPGEIEHALRRDVRDAVVEHEGHGDAARLVAYVVPSAGALDPQATRARLRETLPDYMVPAEFIAVAALPRTANGKLDRAALPAAPAAATTGAAPASATETALAAIWRELLGVATIDRHGDFFLSGGHSLLALRLTDRIHTTFGVRLPPLALFETSRLDALAALIDAERPPSHRPGDPPAAPAANAIGPADDVPAAPVPAVGSGPVGVVPRAFAPPTIVPALPAPSNAKLLARMADGGPGAPFFWVHGVGGEVYSYLHVTRHLARSRPVYGFAADWTTAFAPGDRQVERIAAAYATALLAVRPEGPYHLGGYCSAAVLVLEIARQLEARGRRVGAFTILDYAVVDGTRPSSAPPIMRFARNLPRWIGDDALSSSMADLAGRVRSHVRRRLPWSRRDEISRAEAAPDIRDALGMWRFPDSQVEMLKVHLDVLKAYDPRPFRGRATLLLPRTGPLLGPFPEIQDHGWKAIALGGVDIHSVPGSHSTFLTEPFATTVAERIEDSIRVAEARPADLLAVS